MKSMRFLSLISPLIILSGCYYSKYERLSEQPVEYIDTIYFYNEPVNFYSSNYFESTVAPLTVPYNLNPQTSPTEKIKYRSVSNENNKVKDTREKAGSSTATRASNSERNSGERSNHKAQKR